MRYSIVVEMTDSGESPLTLQEKKNVLKCRKFDISLSQWDGGLIKEEEKIHMKKWKGFIPVMMAAVLLTACGAKQENTPSDQGSGQESAVVQETTASQESADAETQATPKEETKTDGGELTEEEILKRVTKRTFADHDPDANYIIDFVEYPDWASGVGRVERVDDGLYLAAGSIPGGLSYRADKYEIKDRMEIPEGMPDDIKELFREGRFYKGYHLADLRWQGIEYTSIEDAGEFNGYEWCRFDGESVYDMSGNEMRFHITGYTTFLKNSGLPMFVAAMDTTEDQSKVDQLDDLAKNSAMTLYEVDKELMRALPYN